MTRDKECFFIAKWMDRLRVLLSRRIEAPAKMHGVGALSKEMMMKITTTREVVGEFGLKILVHGPPGAGKTRLCATTGDLKHTLIISAEGGLLSVREWEIDVAQVGSIDDVYEVYEFLKRGDHHYRWVCLDSISEIAEVVLAGEKLRNRDARRAYGEMADTVFDLIRGFRNLPCHVLMTAKQGREEIDGRTLHAPMLPGRQLTLNVAYLFDEVFALRVETNSEGEVVRVLQTGKSKSFDAKDRSGALSMFEQADLSAIAAKICGVGAAADPKASEDEEDDEAQEDEVVEQELKVASALASSKSVDVRQAQGVNAHEEPERAMSEALARASSDRNPRAEPGEAPAAKPSPKPMPAKTRLSVDAEAELQRTSVSHSASARHKGTAEELRRAHLRRQLFMLLKSAALSHDQIAAYMLARCEREFLTQSVQEVPLQALELWAAELESLETSVAPGKKASARTAHVRQLLKRHEVWKRQQEAA